MKRAWGSLERRGRKWFVRYRHRGERKRTCVGTVADLGDVIDDEAAAALILGVREELEGKSDEMTFATFLEDYKGAYAASVRTVTLDTVWPTVERLAGLLPGAMRKIDYRAAEQVLATLASNGLKGTGHRPKPNTLRRYAALLRLFWEAARRYGYVDSNPWNELKRDKRLPRRTRRHVPVLTADECRAIEAAIIDGPRPSIEDAVLRSFVCLLFETGLRRGEALALRRTSIRGDLLDVRTTYIPGVGEGEPKTKAAKRTLKLTRVAQAALEAIPSRRGVSTSDRVFAGFMRSQVDYTRLRRKLRAACLRAGIAKENVVTFHGCRHVFAVQCAMAGVPLFQLSKILGHTSIAQTQIYADHVPENFAVLGIEKLEAHRRSSRAN